MFFNLKFLSHWWGQSLDIIIITWGSYDECQVLKLRYFWSFKTWELIVDRFQWWVLRHQTENKWACLVSHVMIFSASHIINSQALRSSWWTDNLLFFSSFLLKKKKKTITKTGYQTNSWMFHGQNPLRK